ncbi:hypothetical protein HanRHA438_Chr17g0823441 [Helianthus annuus]|nr:hypothetical protein HanRHA438_Chr17g0823441 [Helianthus annuus]
MFHAAKLPINTLLTRCACTLRFFSIFFTITSSVRTLHLLGTIVLFHKLRNIGKKAINLHLINNQLINNMFFVSIFILFWIQHPGIHISFIRNHMVHPHLIS